MNVTGKTVGVNGMTGMRGTYLTRRGFVRLAGAAAAGAALGGAVLPLSGCAPAGDVLRVGTKIDVPGFGFQNPETGSVEGLEVDVARELAARIKGDPNALEIVGVNVTTRGAMLDNGTLDATLATFTITDARKKTYDFSRPYYIDHIGVLVLKKSGITDLAGLDGKTVGVALSATTRDKLTAAGDEIGIHMNFAEYSTYPEIKIALVTGRVDAFSVGSLFSGWVHPGGAVALDGIVGAAVVAGGVLVLSVAFDKVTKRRSLGGGDVKLLFMVGLFLGLAGSMLNLLMACLMGLAFAFAQGFSVPSSPGEGEGEGESVRTRAIPFGPAIAAATAFTLLAGPTILTWYAGLF